MPRNNFSQKTAPASQINLFNTTFGDIFTIPQSGNANTCKPKHCGVCGECRRTLHVHQATAEGFGGNGSAEANIAELSKFTSGGYNIGPVNPDPSGETMVSYLGPAFLTEAAASAGCASGIDDCAPQGVFSQGVSVTKVYVPEGPSNQTECLAYAATLPSGEEVAWYTNVNPTLSIALRYM
jgi:hypothetical protein